MIRIRRIFLLALFGALVVLFVMEGGSRNKGILEVYFLDIGQGDSIYIRTPSGRDMLVDGGPGASVLAKLSAVMSWGDRRIDVVMESHPDADHIGGLPEVLGRYEVGMFLEPGLESKNSIDDELHRIIGTRGIPIIYARRGLRIDFGDGAVFDVLFPDMDASHVPDTNTASIVGQVRYGATKVLLTGDSPKAVEDHLISLDGLRLKSDILKAGHHGSRTSSGEEYVRTVDPDYAIVSAGRKNRYGHPHAEVLEIFKRLGIRMARTDEEGTIGFVSDGAIFLRK